MLLSCNPHVVYISLPQPPPAACLSAPADLWAWPHPLRSSAADRSLCLHLQLALTFHSEHAAPPLQNLFALAKPLRPCTTSPPLHNLSAPAPPPRPCRSVCAAPSCSRATSRTRPTRGIPLTPMAGCTRVGRGRECCMKAMRVLHVASAAGSCHRSVRRSPAVQPFCVLLLGCPPDAAGPLLHLCSAAPHCALPPPYTVLLSTTPRTCLLSTPAITQAMWACGSREAASKSSTARRTSSSWRR